MFRLTAAVFCAAATLLAADDDLDSQMKSVIGAYASCSGTPPIR